MTKYSKIHFCNKQIPSCKIIFLDKVELHFVRCEFVFSIQVNILFDVFALMYCQYTDFLFNTKIVSEYDQEIPQSQTADNPVAPRGRAAQPSRDTRKTN